MREEEDKKLAKMKKDEEDRLRREIEEKKEKDMEEKRRRLAEVEQKRQTADKAAKVGSIISINYAVTLINFLTVRTSTGQGSLRPQL